MLYKNDYALCAALLVFKMAECTICYDTFKVQGKIDCCEHVFCFKCINKWSQVMNECPMCKNYFVEIDKIPLKGSRAKALTVTVENKGLQYVIKEFERDTEYYRENLEERQQLIRNLQGSNLSKVLNILGAAQVAHAPQAELIFCPWCLEPLADYTLLQEHVICMHADYL